MGICQCLRNQQQGGRNSSLQDPSSLQFSSHNGRFSDQSSVINNAPFSLLLLSNC